MSLKFDLDFYSHERRLDIGLLGRSFSACVYRYFFIVQPASCMDTPCRMFDRFDLCFRAGTSNPFGENGPSVISGPKRLGNFV